MRDKQNRQSVQDLLMAVQYFVTIGIILNIRDVLMSKDNNFQYLF